MSKKARSARGEVVDFDVLAIKEQLALKPIPVGVDKRRKFIDEKDGIKTRQQIPIASIPSALAVAVEAATAQEDASIFIVSENETTATE